MKITKSSAAEVASNITPGARKLLRAMFIEKLHTPHKVDADQFMALIELIAKGILRADMNCDNQPVAVLERGGRFVIEVLKAETGG